MKNCLHHIVVMALMMVSMTVWADEQPRDTVYFYDTVYVYDTIYVPENAVSSPALPGARVYQQGGEIVVESTTGAPLPLVTVYDAVGRRLTYRAATAAATDNRYTVAVPATGVYLVRVGDAPACRVAVVR